MLDLNSYFIYRIEGDWNKTHHQVTGLLYNHNHKSELTRSIIPHEKTNPKRVRVLENVSPNNYPPSFWITDSNNFPLDIINNWFSQAENKISFPSHDGMQHTISKLENYYQAETIRKSLEKIPSFLIADGHHRYEVIKKNQYQLSLPVFLISSSQASFEFNEIYCHLKSKTNITSTIDNITKNWLTSCQLDEADFKITFNEKEWGYRHKEKNIFNTNDFTLIYQRLQTLHEISTINTSPENPTDFKDCISIKVIHSDVSHVIDEGISGRKMPIKSTCFRHKPDENILQNIANSYSNKFILEGSSL
ncbi:DUF1015 family protein [Vibrio hepatarius]|uniref:DUF1015 family protein n=1 Tax=Vibrio hepatarius TaxID=171383 RepID=UPI001C081271|nr:DUF1015 family protein [Vibrio hepatarius]MBU2898746.1 DUF1015 domain-containing protein [Vibrio hepatarius]